MYCVKGHVCAFEKPVHSKAIMLSGALHMPLVRMHFDEAKRGVSKRSQLLVWNDNAMDLR